MCGAQTEEAKDLVITSTIQGREIVITGLSGTRCPECGEQYVDAESSKKALETANKFRKPAIIFCPHGSHLSDFHKTEPQLKK
jgi:YgiT-type zinc finger domain-containing protein